MDDNSELRRQAVLAISNYMHHELFELTGPVAGKMLPWMTDQAGELMAGVDRAIANTRLEGKKRGIL